MPVLILFIQREPWESGEPPVYVQFLFCLIVSVSLLYVFFNRLRRKRPLGVGGWLSLAGGLFFGVSAFSAVGLGSWGAIWRLL